MSSEDFISTEPVLWIYDESLLRPRARARRSWSGGWKSPRKNNVLPVRELVLVNAEKGTISLHFNQVDTAWHASGLSNVSAQDATPTATPEPAETPVVTETAEPVATTLPVTEEASGLQTDPKSVGSEAVTGVTWYVATTGNNASSCSVKETPCLTIDGALNKASAGDAILVAQGVYSAGSMGGIVVYLTKNVNLSGGWNSSFTAQVGNSTIDGLNSRLGMSIHALVTVIDHFSIQNSKGTYGGGIMSAGGDVTLNHLYIHHNYSSEGGGINQNSGSLVINNSTISENTSSGVGGAVYSQSGSLTINSSTIVRNTAQQGGGYYNYGESIILHNTILANNTAGIGKDCSGAISLSDHSIIGSTAGCTISSQDGDQQNVDPLVAPIAIGTVGYHPLLGGSPAIDAGNPATCTAVDQRSLPRPQGAACDIGAYEYTTPSAPAVMSLVDGSNQAAAPNLPFDKPLSVSVVDSQGTPVSGKDVLFTAPGSGPSLAFTGGISQLTVATNGNGIAALVDIDRQCSTGCLYCNRPAD